MKTIEEKMKLLIEKQLKNSRYAEEKGMKEKSAYHKGLADGMQAALEMFQRSKKTTKPLVIVIKEIICDGCGEQFKTTLDEDDDPMPLDEEAEEFGWTVNEGSIYCDKCQHLDPDQAQGYDLDYSRRIL